MCVLDIRNVCRLREEQDVVVGQLEAEDLRLKDKLAGILSAAFKEVCTLDGNVGSGDVLRVARDCVDGVHFGGHAREDWKIRSCSWLQMVCKFVKDVLDDQKRTSYTSLQIMLARLQEPLF